MIVYPRHTHNNNNNNNVGRLGAVIIIQLELSFQQAKGINDID